MAGLQSPMRPPARSRQNAGIVYAAQTEFALHPSRFWERSAASQERASARVAPKRKSRSWKSPNNHLARQHRCRSSPPPFSRREAYFRNCRKIPLRSIEKHWVSRNVLILQFSFHIEARPQMYLVANRIVLPGPASRHEIPSHRTFLVEQLQAVARRKPISQPALKCSSVSANRITYKSPPIRISVAIVAVKIIELAAVGRPPSVG